MLQDVEYSEGRWKFKENGKYTYTVFTQYLIPANTANTTFFQLDFESILSTLFQKYYPQPMIGNKKTFS